MSTYVVTMAAPAGWGGPVTGTPSGTVYVPNSAGLVSAENVDIDALLKLGFTTVAPQMQPYQIPLWEARASNLQSLGTATAAGVPSLTQSLGTSAPVIATEVANSGTKTDTFCLEFTLPQNYKSTGSTTVEVNAQVVETAGATLSESQLAVSAWSVSPAGVLSSNLISSSATQSVTATTAGSFSFPVTDTSLVAGERMVVEFVSQQIETAGTNAHMQINSVIFHN